MVREIPSQRQLIREFSITPRKSLGQNFIVEEGVLNKIADMCHCGKDETVVEIGAGLGGLTSRLAFQAKEVLGIEKDKRLSHLLKTRIIRQNNIKIIQQDALHFNYETAAAIAGGRIKVVGNLPYVIASRLTIKLLRTKRCIEEMILMYQKEVADRFTSLPGSKNYGFLTLIAGLYADIEPLLSVGREVFFPRPKVESALVRFKLLSEPREYLINERFFAMVVKAAFSQRRKKLRNALALKNDHLSPDIIEKVCAEIDVDPNRRGETLSLQEFALLSNQLFYLLNPNED